MSATDFDLHGLIGLRLLDATEEEASGVGRQLGLSPTKLARPPDIVIRWVNQQTSALRLIGDYEAGFDDESFYVLRGRHKARLRVRIPFASIGREPLCDRREVVCDRGVTEVPHLVPIINLTLLSKGVAAIHASAFLYQGLGIVAAGWSKGGKTEALLSFLARGAEYVADDWTYVDSDGGIFGIAEPVRVRSWHLDDLPKFNERIGLRTRARLRALGLADRWKDIVPERGAGWPIGIVRRVLHLLGRHAFVTVPPPQLFDWQIASQPARLDHLFFVVSHTAPEIRVESIASAEVAERMVFSVEEERERFLSCYRKFRFAFPDRANPLIDASQQRQRQLLVAALARTSAHLVLHPYPLRISALFEHMQPVLERGNQAFRIDLRGTQDASEHAAGGELRHGNR